MKTPLEQAIAIVGNQSAMARKVGVTPQAVQQWVGANRVPALKCMAVEQATDGVVTRYALRPDVFGECPKNERAA